MVQVQLVVVNCQFLEKPNIPLFNLVKSDLVVEQVLSKDN